MSAMVLEIDALSVSFGAIRALKEVSLSVESGATWGVVGANGSGKTTLLNLISGIYSPTGGSVTYRSRDITRLKPFHSARSGLVRTFQHPQLTPELSILDNVLVGTARPHGHRHLHLRSSDDRRRAVEAIEMVGAGAYVDSVPGEVPFGMQKLVEVARAMIAKPDVLLLDEPAAGLNSEERVNLAVLIEHLRESRPQAAILLIEHDVDFIRRVSDRLIALESGTTIGLGEVDTVLGSSAVRRSLLGKLDDEVGDLT